MLRGVRIVELAPLFPSPYAGRILLDMGASVTKVNPPIKKSGDLLHIAAQKHAASNSGGNGGSALDGAYAAMYHQLNKGKRQLEFDLTNEVQRTSLLEEHIAKADVLISGYRPGSLDKVNMSPRTLRERYPHLVICVVSGYGLTGPLAHHAGHDLNYLARNGVLAMQLPRVAGGTAGDSDGKEVLGDGRAMSPLPVQVADVAGGTYPAVINILGGLINSQRHQRDEAAAAAATNGNKNNQQSLAAGLDGLPGGGGIYDISMADCSQSLLVLSQTAHEYSGGLLEVTNGAFNLCGSSPCYNVYRTKDGGFMAVGALEPAYWRRAVETLGLPIAEFTKAKVQTGFGLDDDELKGVFRAIAEVFLTKTRDEWTAVFQGVDAMVDPVLSPNEALASEHTKARRQAVTTTFNAEQAQHQSELVPPTIVSMANAVAGNDDKNSSKSKL